MFSRADKIRKAIMREVSDIIQRGIKDPRISGIVSVTDVEVSSDYRYAKVYVSIFGDEAHKEQTMEALVDSEPRVRSEIGKRIRLRHTPEITFHIDDSFDKASRITSLLDKIKKGEL